eukprot:COSAG05_NODE_10343_length_570_cov_1.197452_1_plen_65_part_00
MEYTELHTRTQVIKLTDIFEGSIIRAMRRLEELLRQLCSAANSIGNEELEAKFNEGKDASPACL